MLIIHFTIKMDNRSNESKGMEARSLMEFLFDPNVAYVLLAVAFFSTIFALLAPGTGILEILSLILLILVGFTVKNMTVNPWAIVLLLGSVIVVLVSLKRSWKWYFTAASILALLAGMLFFYKEEGRILAIDPLLALFVSGTVGAFIWIIGHNTVAALNLKPQRDPDSVIGLTGKALTDIHTDGSVYVGGENWSAMSDSRIAKGNQVVVLQRSGLVLKVESIPEKTKQKKNS
ncbi:MAG TPA: hypothetical protein DCK95_12230 [Anaerolineaceae bacterium]|nr:hypothetical protein [Anaerolineaceae bacterium]